jgi:hypothetical protein
MTQPASTMPSADGATSWRRVFLAAARLGGLYVIGVALMLTPFMLLPGGGLPGLRDLVRLAAPAGILFAVAFILLALARRAGFAALWVLLTGLWTAMLIAHEMPIDIMVGFVAWSVFAVPLHVLGALGVPSSLHLRIGRWRLRAATTGTVLWLVLLIPAAALLSQNPFFVFPLELPVWYRVAGFLAPFVWAPTPFLIASLSAAHVWSGTARR